MQLPDWKEKKSVIARTFVFKNFGEAVDFVNKVASIAEKADHHPDIKIFDYKFVEIVLTTHSAGRKVTKKDYDMAEEIDSLQ